MVGLLAGFPNPQNEPGMEQRLLLVLVLTFVVVVLFQPFLKKYLPQAPAPPAQTQPPAPMQPPAQAPAAAAPSGTGSTVRTLAVTKQASAELETVLENDLYRITFVNRGGQVKSWILKKYEDDRGLPLDLVNSAAAAKYGYPLSLWTYDEALRNKLNSVLYVPSRSGQNTAPAEITFEYADQDFTR